jgi:hypothetical protein
MLTESQYEYNSKIRPKDVIQIYRVFNTFRDSGKDRGNEIKLIKLKDFPFFSEEDYAQIKKKVCF